MPNAWCPCWVYRWWGKEWPLWACLRWLGHSSQCSSRGIIVWNIGICCCPSIFKYKWKMLLELFNTYTVKINHHFFEILLKRAKFWFYDITMPYQFFRMIKKTFIYCFRVFFILIFKSLLGYCMQFDINKMIKHVHIMIWCSELKESMSLLLSDHDLGAKLKLYCFYFIKSVNLNPFIITPSLLHNK